ncbi:ripening-related protein grip22-like [Gastrolobium bilobum]|uniref:ripening-related protein grip22-like n=1 Tax=Gastrolobium bilobum TaxID=150636 RepID=UPI002AB26237|nr:ripening-related protein grip22-like [Gastrolobium bilobum]
MAAHTTSRLVFLSASIFLFNVINLPFLTNALSSCNGACSTSNDCDGQLICINGNCNDDPDVGTQICSGGDMPSASGGDCKSSGTLNCDDGKSFSQFTCSPQVLSSTQAILTLNDFSEGGDGGAPSECDEKFHSNSEKVVALSTGWYNKGSRCGQMITITSATSGKSVEAMVVDECDSLNGCDSEHAYQGPCRNNIVDGSQAVWDALGLNSGEESVTWSMA